MAQPLLQLEADRRFEPGHHRERRSLIRRHLVHGTFVVRPIEAPVQCDHLPVQVVQRPQPQVAALGELGERDVTLVAALQQGADRRGLEEHVMLALGVQVGVAHRLHVQRPDPALVEHGTSLPSGPVGKLVLFAPGGTGTS